jgi:DHA1 family bicyclomycin/chloramphenicol resistance-like MFS transporter
VSALGRRGAAPALRPDSLALMLFLAGVVAVGPLSTDMYLPSLPDMTRIFDTDVSVVQLTLSVFMAGFAVAQLAYGPLSDRYGRLPFLLGGLGIFFAASLACAFATNIEMLIGLRFLQALGASAGPVLARAIVRDLHDREAAARMLSYLGAVMGFAPAAGPVIGGYLHNAFGWQANFIALTVLGGGAWLLVRLLLRETLAQPDPHALAPRRLVSNYSAILGDRAFLGYGLTGAFAFSGLFAFISGSSFILIDVLGVASDTFGYYFGLIVLCFVAGALAGGRLVTRHGLDRLLSRGVGILPLAGLAMAGLAWGGVASVAAVIAPMALYMVAVGLVLPNTLAGALAPYPHKAGRASALFGSLQMASGALAGAAVGILHDGTQTPMAVIIAAMGLSAFAAHTLLVHRRPAQA